MPNPINVSISVTQPNVKLYISVDSFSSYTQQATIQCPNQQTLLSTGSGENARQDSWAYPITATGIYDFECYIEYDDGTGSGLQPSQSVQTASINQYSLNQTVVFSEDSGDGDMNDCFITFIWFGTGSDETR